MIESIVEMQKALISAIITDLIEKDELDGFIHFARKKAKEDGMDDDDLMEFFDNLEENFCKGIPWVETLTTIEKVTGFKVKGFKGDKCVIIENEELTDDYCTSFIKEEKPKGKINLTSINKELETLNVRLEFIEAMNTPFKVGDFQNFCRFRVVELDK